MLEIQKKKKTSNRKFRWSGRSLGPSDQIRHVHGHFVNLSGVKLFNVSENADVVVLHEVDCNTLAPKSTRPTNSVNVKLSVVGKVIVDDKGHLRHIKTPCPHVCGDEHTLLAAAELLHDLVSLVLRHVSMHGCNSEIVLPHLLGQPVHLAARIAENDCLCDGQGVVQVTQRVELPLLLLHCHEKLLDALQRQLIALHKDADGVGHELGCHVEDLTWQGGGDDHHLRGWGKVAVHIINLLLKALAQHFVGLVKDKQLDVTSAKIPPTDHIEHTAGSSGHNMHTKVELPNVLSDGLATNASMALNVHEVTECQDHLLNLLSQLTRG
mmetsp:Transcript_13433/g.34256  ORF Transcript_13433/g.34256 Transcript_13433/m.34256 type:complete len:324 (-) Transcript_13433:313-1284(-)